MVQLCLNDLIHQFRTKPSIHDPLGGALPIQTAITVLHSRGVLWVGGYQPAIWWHQHLPHAGCDNLAIPGAVEHLLVAKVTLVEKYSSGNVEGRSSWGRFIPRDHCLPGSHDSVVNNWILNWETYTFISPISSSILLFVWLGNWAIEKLKPNVLANVGDLLLKEGFDWGRERAATLPFVPDKCNSWEITAFRVWKGSRRGGGRGPAS